MQLVVTRAQQPELTLFARMLVEVRERRGKGAKATIAAKVERREPRAISAQPYQHKRPPMLLRVAAGGRFFELDPVDWSMLIVGSALAGLVTLLF